MVWNSVASRKRCAGLLVVWNSGAEPQALRWIAGLVDPRHDEAGVFDIAVGQVVDRPAGQPGFKHCTEFHKFSRDRARQIRGETTTVVMQGGKPLRDQSLERLAHRRMAHAEFC